MMNIDSILQQIDDDGDHKQIRVAILNLIEHHLQSLKETLGSWEKLCFADAISHLAWNINSSRKYPSTIWLRLSVSDIEKALTPSNLRNENYIPINKHIESLTWDHLMEDVKTLRLLC